MMANETSNSVGHQKPTAKPACANRVIPNSTGTKNVHAICQTSGKNMMDEAVTTLTRNHVHGGSEGGMSCPATTKGQATSVATKTAQKVIAAGAMLRPTT